MCFYGWLSPAPFVLKPTQIHRMNGPKNKYQQHRARKTAKPSTVVHLTIVLMAFNPFNLNGKQKWLAIKFMFNKWAAHTHAIELAVGILSPAILFGVAVHLNWFLFVQRLCLTQHTHTQKTISFCWVCNVRQWCAQVFCVKTYCFKHFIWLLTAAASYNNIWLCWYRG